MSNPRRLIVAVACAASLLLGLAATPALATHFQRESYQELLAQLHRREVVAVVLHPKGYKAHASLSGGRHVTVTYTPVEVAQLSAAARGGGSSFTVATSTRKATTVHHKLRYIAGGVLIVVILVVLAVLLVGRRRELVEDDEPSEGGEAASTPPAP
jgi:multidrug efflux pump subunit AcrB